MATVTWRHDEDLDGLCVKPNSPKGEILLWTKRPPQAFLESALHEAMHALNWHITEDVIGERARELSRWLWRLGYRRGK